MQVLRPDDGAPLQVVHAPFGTACLGSLAADEGRVVVTDTTGAVHALSILRAGSAPDTAPLPAPSPSELAEDVPFTVGLPHGTDTDDESRRVQLQRVRAGRVELALEAAEYHGVLQALTKDDVAALVPAAYAHAARQPGAHSFPPARSADELVTEYSQHLDGRASLLGPPH